MGCNWNEAVRAMGYDTWKTTDPPDVDARDEQREDEAMREQRWAAFIEWMRDILGAHSLPMVLHDVGVAHANGAEDWVTVDQRKIANFAETEGWPGVLSAIARAMREHEQELAEVEKRR